MLYGVQSWNGILYGFLQCSLLENVDLIVYSVRLLLTLMGASISSQFCCRLGGMHI